MSERDDNPYGKAPRRSNPGKGTLRGQRAAASAPAAAPARAPKRSYPADSHAPVSAPSNAPPARERREMELRVFGLNACLAVFARRPEAIRKVYLTEARMSVLKPILAWCARERVGYRLVANDDLERLTQSAHHEGVCFDVLRQPPQALAEFLAARRGDAPSLLILLDGVGNPHNFGAVLRIAAHFAADAVLLPPGSTLALSGAACRVAEGGAESVALVGLTDMAQTLDATRRAGYTAIATVVRDGSDLYAQPLPKRSLLIFGAEGGGLTPALLNAVSQRIMVPGTGQVESLNIASAVSVVAAEFWRQHRRS
jgi:RNA methyltransferase, TrmH family